MLANFKARFFLLHGSLFHTDEKVVCLVPPFVEMLAMMAQRQKVYLRVNDSNRSIAELIVKDKALS